MGSTIGHVNNGTFMIPLYIIAIIAGRGVPCGRPAMIAMITVQNRVNNASHRRATTRDCPYLRCMALPAMNRRISSSIITPLDKVLDTFTDGEAAHGYRRASAPV